MGPSLLRVICCIPFLAIGCSPSPQHNEDVKTALYSFPSPPESPSTSLPHALFLMKKGLEEEALKAYLDHYHVTGEHNFATLSSLGYSLIERGLSAKSYDTVIRALYGAWVTHDTRFLPFFRGVFSSQNPHVQHAVLHILATSDDTASLEALYKGLSSLHPSVALETAHILAQKKHGLERIEALMHKFDPSHHHYFATFYAGIHTPRALALLKNMFYSDDEGLRCEAIYSATEYSLDELLPDIHTLATHHSIAQRRACAHAFAAFGDTTAIDILHEYCSSPDETLRLLGYHALKKLGEEKALEPILVAARKKNVFAIALLRHHSEGIEVLASLSSDESLSVRINAGLALLHHRDIRCLDVVEEICLHDLRDLAFFPYDNNIVMPWYIATTSHAAFKDKPLHLSLSLSLREETLRLASSLPRETFLLLADDIFLSQQHDLLPTLISLLEYDNSISSRSLLKRYQQYVGAPFIRGSCTLALFRLKEEGPYKSELFSWLKRYASSHEISFRPSLPWHMKTAPQRHTLTPKETSHLILETYRTLAASPHEDTIENLVEILAETSPENRPALAGHLITAIQ
jgi:hypothetical protein